MYNEKKSINQLTQWLIKKPTMIVSLYDLQLPKNYMVIQEETSNSQEHEVSEKFQTGSEESIIFFEMISSVNIWPTRAWFAFTRTQSYCNFTFLFASG